MVSAVDIGYGAYDWTRGVIKNTFGEDAAQTFDSVMGTLKKVIMAVAAIGVGFSIMAGVLQEEQVEQQQRQQVEQQEEQQVEQEQPQEV